MKLFIHFISLIKNKGIYLHPNFINNYPGKISDVKQPILEMKKDIHPANYRPCVLKDMGSGDYIITRSCAETKDTLEVDGVDYPLIKMEVSSFSHPFFTGKMKILDTAGRVDKFKNRYAKFQK
jgi:large subunit ribosomal protein L31